MSPTRQLQVDVRMRTDPIRAQMLALIRRWRDEHNEAHYLDMDWADVDLLLAEIDRRTVILRPIVLADPSIVDADGDEVCFFCGWANDEHPEDCPWRQAKELLGDD